MHKGCRRLPRAACHGLTRGACRTALLLTLASWLGGCDADQVTSAITCSSGSYGSEVTQRNDTQTLLLGPETTGGTMQQIDFATRFTILVLR